MKCLKCVFPCCAGMEDSESPVRACSRRVQLWWRNGTGSAVLTGRRGLLEWADHRTLPARASIPSRQVPRSDGRPSNPLVLRAYQSGVVPQEGVGARQHKVSLKAPACPEDELGTTCVPVRPAGGDAHGVPPPPMAGGPMELLQSTKGEVGARATIGKGALCAAQDGPGGGCWAGQRSGGHGERESNPGPGKRSRARCIDRTHCIPA